MEEVFPVCTGWKPRIVQSVVDGRIVGMKRGLSRKEIEEVTSKLHRQAKKLHLVQPKSKDDKLGTRIELMTSGWSQVG